MTFSSAGENNSANKTTDRFSADMTNDLCQCRRQEDDLFGYKNNEDLTHQGHRFTNTSKEVQFYQNLSMQQTPPLLCAIPLSELIKKTLTSGFPQTQKEVQIEDSE